MDDRVGVWGRLEEGSRERSQGRTDGGLTISRPSMKNVTTPEHCTITNGRSGEAAPGPC